MACFSWPEAQRAFGERGGGDAGARGAEAAAEEVEPQLQARGEWGGEEAPGGGGHGEAPRQGEAGRGGGGAGGGEEPASSGRGQGERP